ncbi:phage portal protein [Streptococcus hyointestinalis]|nr:phage portal protein [Streptococcus hyointestinalis]
MSAETAILRLFQVILWVIIHEKTLERKEVRSVLGLLSNLFSFKKSATFEDVDEKGSQNFESKNIALKEAALNKCVNYVARTVSKARFNIKVENERSSEQDQWWYWLNVRPNVNQTASYFWQEVIKLLLTDGEVLLFVDNSQLYYADSFSRKQDLASDIYTVSRVQSQSYDKEFLADDVVYLRSDNDSLRTYTEQLWKDYGDLLGRALNNQRTVNQLRFTIDMSKDRVRSLAQETADGEQANAKKNFLQRVSQRIREDEVVGIPISERSNYQEYTGRNGSKTYVNDIKSLRNQYIDEVAELLGIPTALIHGEMADNQKNYEQYLRVAVDPLVNKLVDGLSVAIFDQKESIAGASIKVTGIRNYNIFTISTQVDKLISSSFANVDELREEVGLEPLPDGLGQRYYMTKNYQETHTKGGEENDGAETNA